METRTGKAVILSVFLFISFLLPSGCTSADEETEKTIDRQKEKVDKTIDKQKHGNGNSVESYDEKVDRSLDNQEDKINTTEQRESFQLSASR